VLIDERETAQTIERGQRIAGLVLRNQLLEQRAIPEPRDSQHLERLDLRVTQVPKKPDEQSVRRRSEVLGLRVPAGCHYLVVGVDSKVKVKRHALAAGDYGLTDGLIGNAT